MSGSLSFRTLVEFAAAAVTLVALAVPGFGVVTSLADGGSTSGPVVTSPPLAAPNGHSWID
ncbi:hypothetical protein OHS58_24535 [Amycolatopsis sp. NBC_00348]|uniref:hypothetical protein n=1 Tax=Amycolatopsis sp. NBC_00348 TaxID=2975956 RepID=UPI002E26BEE4